MAIQWKLAELIREKERLERRVIPLREIKEATDISVPVLSNMCSPHKHYVTNTRTIEKLKRYFGCRWEDLMDETLVDDEEEDPGG